MSSILQKVLMKVARSPSKFGGPALAATIGTIAAHSAVKDGEIVCGFSQEVLARHLGVSRKTINSYIADLEKCGVLRERGVMCLQLDTDKILEVSEGEGAAEAEAIRAQVEALKGRLEVLERGKLS